MDLNRVCSFGIVKNKQLVAVNRETRYGMPVFVGEFNLIHTGREHLHNRAHLSTLKSFFRRVIE